MATAAEFAIGQSVVVERHVSLDDVDRFCELSGDTSAIHVDESAAHARNLDGRVAHGVLISSFVSAVIGTELPGDDGIMQSIQMNFRNPVIPPETLVIKAEIIGISAAVGQLTIRVEVRQKTDGTLAATGEVRSLVR